MEWLKIFTISALSAIVGGVGTWFIITNIKKWSLTRNKQISWEEVKVAFKNLEEKIINYNPEIIVALADGMVVSGIISTNIRLCNSSNYSFPPFLALGILKTNGGNYELLGQELISDLEGKKVLLVDSHIYTGRTLKKAIDFVKTKNPNEIKSLVLFDFGIQNRIVEPDYYGLQMGGGDKRRKVPWSLTEYHEKLYNT